MCMFGDNARKSFTYQNGYINFPNLILPGKAKKLRKHQQMVNEEDPMYTLMMAENGMGDDVCGNVELFITFIFILKVSIKPDST